MLEKIKSFFGEGTDSKDLAKERLKLVLIHDRINISPELLEDMEADLIEVISKYVEIEQENLNIDLDKDNESMALVANIPVKSLNRTVKK
ncbi:cell division topological specificity factor MinE [Selenihalanaerobacter shriftii]|uniref:Cell division topological specificity factor n=1 Tax=Selenihalanaerobacter shriftii TaxID=142842 RepID=A0A1T4PN19_9FIRM|nr:cell division topological specificity factor MinE [Selenihalanaerobacter shriftii]SJZ92950.1 cell division topological specificity factor MinE [Selenihalanaerobacter shriftii]